MLVTTQNKRENIMTSALALFAERGFDATTVPMIATSANVGAGTIYRYFENKEVLVNTLFQDYVRTFTKTIEDQFPYHQSVRDQFHHIFKAMILFTNQNEHALYFIKKHSAAHFLDSQSQEDFTQLLNLLRSFFDIGKQQSVIRNLPSEALIAILYGAFLELQNLVRAGELHPDLELLSGIENSLWDSVRSHS
ncbi:TetR/AcrR family transcriptional regulator [Anaerobacillus sp. 1_MG-2023]|uniref:TetR/AcrR family transcriptional regulator n=1 Tax=Anaerobacillus sp. 1_MG-2023 TaxID=3062655 RepID=UPI0026E470E5|nr:TetR/AcrR family transcriptional regulator [Anaerobacillus sp. 1_MG-2023]MDO6654885.1 TetR/AcrR family transcriptional regulator [Anaerobacillus sp. 1_MG-2023]